MNIDRKVIEQALAQLEINRANFRKGPSKSICKMLAGGNDEVITALRDALAQPAVADPFTYVIQHLNSNPYNLTKDECVQKIKELRDAYKIGGAE
jgi:hypothetical protein